MSEYIEVLFWALIGVTLSLSVGAGLIANKRVAQRVGEYATPFAAGALLGAAFLDLLPEAVEQSEPRRVFMSVVVAIIVFFLLERYLDRFHFHEKEKATARNKATAPLILMGDGVHNSLDGVVIGAAFLVSTPVGIITTLAICAHEIPRKAGDFGVLIRSGMARKRVLLWNSLSGVATVLFAVATFTVGTNEDLPLGIVLGFSAGLLIYVSMSDLIPTIHDEAKARFAIVPVLLLVSGLVIVASAAAFAHQYIDDGHDHEAERSHVEGEHSHKEADHHYQQQ